MQVPSEKAGSNKQDLSGHSFVPTWLAQAVQQPFPDTRDSGSPSRPSPAPGNARRPEGLGSATAPGSGPCLTSVSPCVPWSTACRTLLAPAPAPTALWLAAGSRAGTRQCGQWQGAASPGRDLRKIA